MEGFSSVAKKRKNFIRDIQNLQRSNMMKRVRSQTVLFIRKEELNELIAITQNEIDAVQLDSLCRYANMQEPKAIAHLGNLIIQGKVKVSQLQDMTFKPGYHPYWLWLIEVMVEREYCTLPLIQHCIKSISLIRSASTVSHALSILYKITVSHLYSPLFLKDQTTLIHILGAALRPDSASARAFLLINQIIKKNDEDLSQRLEKGSNLRQKMITVLHHGSLSLNKKIKRLTAKIFEGLMAKGVYLAQLGDIVIRMLANCIEDGSEQDMFNFMLMLISKESPENIVALLDKGLIIQLANLKQIIEQEGDRDSQAAIIDLSRQLNERASFFGYLSKGVQKELNKYGLLSFSNSIEFC